MADTDKAQKTESTASAPSGDRKIPVQMLIEQSEGFLGVRRHVAAGALRRSGEDRLTVEDAKKRVQNWLSKPLVKEA